MEQILQSSPKSIHEHSLWGQAPLHLSCNWPKGIILLLRHGGEETIDRPDRGGFLPLAYACASNCLEAVKLILEADSALYYSDVEWNNRHPRYRSVFEEATEMRTDEILSHLQTALVDRRSRLYSLATKQLCREDLERLKLRDDRILDEKAFDVYKALEIRSIPVPLALRITPVRKTIFHDQYLSPALGESLHGRGFIDMDGVDCTGLTPLMSMGVPNEHRLETALRRVGWLRSKGADLGRKPDQQGWDYPSIPAAHFICSWVGRAAYLQDDTVLPGINHTWLFGIFQKLDHNCQSLLEELLSSKFFDSCLCACSSHGCTPPTMMLKGITQGLEQYMTYWDVIHPHPIEGRIWVIAWMENLLGHRHEAWRWLSRGIIRGETFEGLHFTHTCCEADLWNGEMPVRKANEDCEEIRDKERFLIGKLDALVAEFQEKYIELGVSVTEFLKGYWKARMEEVKREEELLNDGEIAKIRDMGVVIHS